MRGDNIEGDDQVRLVGQHEPTIGGESAGLKPQLSRYLPACVYANACEVLLMHFSRKADDRSFFSFFSSFRGRYEQIGYR